MTRTYLVECYWPGVSEAAVSEAIGRAVEGRAELAVRHVDSVLIPADEIVLSIFEGASEDAVRSAAQSVGLPSERIVETVRIHGDQTKREDR